MERNPLPPDPMRSEVECDVLATFEARGGFPTDGGSNSFRNALESLNTNLTDGRAAWRRGRIGLNADKIGARVQLPGPAHIPAQLARIRRLLVSKDGTPAIYVATTVLALVVNCHPFTDGNGRLARLLFNHVLRQAGMAADVYLPISEIGRRSRGGYEIALRVAEIQGDWRALIDFMLSALRCCNSVARQRQTDAPPHARTREAVSHGVHPRGGTDHANPRRA